jgi:transposase
VSGGGRARLGAQSPHKVGPGCSQAPLTVAPPRREHAGETLQGRNTPDAASTNRGCQMQVIYERCCGLDVHKKTVVACRVTPGPDGRPQQELRSFRTMTGSLLELRDWLEAAGVTHVAMESTGVYWRPVYNLLEDGFTVLVVNAQHIKAVPGRKTDVRDAEWIAQLLQHGLLQGSFIPDRPQRELRDLTRYRSTLIRERAREIQRLQKTLEDTNLKLASVVSDITGVSARAMLEALLAQETDPTRLAALAKGRLREKREELEQALVGVVRPHHRFMLAEQLSHLDYLDEAIARVDGEVEARLTPFARELELLDAIPGVSRRVAQVLLAEIGGDLSRFASAAHLASWAGMCPGYRESAGKRASGKTRKGSPWLRATLVEAAHGAARSRGTYLAAQYRRLAARRGSKKAAVAVGHSILTIAYHLLTRGEVYHDLGANYFDQRDQQAVQRRLVSRLERLGYQVNLTPVAA